MIVDNMEKISKGDTAKIDGYIITADEQKEYVQMKKNLAELKIKFNAYLDKYYPNGYRKEY